ncbi:tyrosine-type recombinase/integrase [Rhizobium beringeri]
MIGYVERHALDGSADSGKAMCGVVRAFLRYLHLKGFISMPLAGCVPSIRRWRLAGLPTFLPPEKVQKVLDACDRTTAMGRRDYAVLMILAKLGLARQRSFQPSILTISTGSRARSSYTERDDAKRLCRCVTTSEQHSSLISDMGVQPRHVDDFSYEHSPRTWVLHLAAPSRGSLSKHSEQADIEGYAHHGAHLFRHSLATDLLRSGASFAEIGQLLRHRSIDSTRIYAKLDIDKLRELSLPWPGGVQ